MDEAKQVLVLSQAREGKLDDKRFHDEDDIAGSVPDEMPIEVDLGFLGLHKEYVNIHLPHKKPRGGQLSVAQKQENRALSLIAGCLGKCGCWSQALQCCQCGLAPPA